MEKEMTKTEKALRIILEEGITAKEAAERVGITSAAVSKGKLHPSKTMKNIQIIEQLRAELAEVTKQRDKLVEALEYAIDSPACALKYEFCECKACKALAAVKGETK